MYTYTVDVAHLLLLHELGVGAIVDDILAEDGGGERAVDLLGVDVLDLSVEDEVVALGVEADSHLATEENESEHIAVLLPVSAFILLAMRHVAYLLLLGEEELVRVHAIGDCATNHREQVEDDRRLIGVLEQQLLQNVEDNREDEEGRETGGDHDRRGRIGGKVANRPRHIGEDTHTARQDCESVRERCCCRRGARLYIKFPWS
jgi:hypothetical protein